MEQNTNQNYLSNELSIDAVAYAHLTETAKWGKFLGITGMVASVFLIIAGFFVSSIFSSLNQMPGTNPITEFGGGFLTVLYVVLGIIFLALSWLMFKFGAKTLQGLRSSDQVSLNNGLANLKILFRIYGIIVIIYLGFIALAFVASIIGALMK